MSAEYGLVREVPDPCDTDAMRAITIPRAILAVDGHANGFDFLERWLVHTYAAMTPADPTGIIPSRTGRTASGATGS